MALSLVHPVDQHARRADHEKMLTSLDLEVAHCRECLNAFAEAHLVTQDRPSLGERKLCAKAW